MGDELKDGVGVGVFVGGGVGEFDGGKVFVGMVTSSPPLLPGETMVVLMVIEIIIAIHMLPFSSGITRRRFSDSKTPFSWYAMITSGCRASCIWRLTAYPS